ncbi:hypothetical protein P7C70_g2397, partial [Phenoliferia sp. Uapishka_3]
MHFSTLVVSPLVAASIVQAACTNGKKGHRRHHAKIVPTTTDTSSGSAYTQALAVNPKQDNNSWSGTWSSSSDSDSSSTDSWSSATSTAVASASSSTSTSSSSTSTTGYSLSGIKKNGIYVGMLPDDGSGGGTATTMAALNSALGMQGAAQGWYAQAQSGVAFDGSQLLPRMADIKASGGVFQPAVMPTGGWGGLTASDNSQAVNICNVMKKFTDEGIEVWLRFAHEVNYYQTDGTYTGNAADFKAGWAAVAAACKSIAPEVKMWFTPNVADLAQYDEYYPDDPSTVDIIGIDWYPSDATTSFVDGVQPFHDKYTSSTTKFAQGETGLAQAGSISDRLTWLTQMTSSATASALPNLISISWFNYYKGYEFRIVDVTGQSAVSHPSLFRLPYELLTSSSFADHLLPLIISLGAHS